MATPKAAAKKQVGKGANGFPAEAEDFYGEVSEQRLQALRKEMCDQYPSEDWELVDGIDYPYPKCA